MFGISKPRPDLTAPFADFYQMGAHGAMGQVRKFSGLPYHTHPQAVAEILKAHYPAATPTMIAAALLHDVIEDTGVGTEALAAMFGQDVTDIVVGLTNVKRKWPDGKPMYNRAAQKRLDALRMAQQPFAVKLIKLCDRLHNLPDIIENDPSHAKVYVPETRYLLDNALRNVHDDLWNKLDKIVCDYNANNA